MLYWQASFFQGSAGWRVLVSPVYQFQILVADYYTIKAKTWLVLADRLTGWVSVFYFAKEATDKQLVTIVREMFTTFGVAENMASSERRR